MQTDLEARRAALPATLGRKRPGDRKHCPKSSGVPPAQNAAARKFAGAAACGRGAALSPSGTTLKWKADHLYGGGVASFIPDGISKTNSVPGARRSMRSLAPVCFTNAWMRRMPRPVLLLGSNSKGRPTPSSRTETRAIPPPACALGPVVTTSGMSRRRSRRSRPTARSCAFHSPIP